MAYSVVFADLLWLWLMSWRLVKDAGLEETDGAG